MSIGRDEDRINYLIASLIILTTFYISFFPDPGYFESDSTKYLYTIVLSLNVGLIIYLFIKTRRELVKMITLTRMTVLILIAILVVGFLIREFYVPHVVRILFDEDIYMQIALLMSQTGKAEFCDYRFIDGVCLDGNIDKHPNSFPHALAFIYLFTGYSDSISFTFTVLIGSISIILIALLSHLIMKDQFTPILTALMLALTPSHIIWSGSISSEVYHAFASILLVIAHVAYHRRGSDEFLLLTAALLAYTTQIRPESIFMIPVSTILIIISSIRNGRIVLFRSLLYFTLFFMILGVLNISHLRYFSSVHDWGSEEGKFQLDYLERNWEPNVYFWVNGRRHLLFTTPLFLIGLAIALRKRDYLLLGIASWFFIFFITYIFFYAGSFTSGGIGFRYAVVCYPPFLILCAYAAGWLINQLSNYVSKRNAMLFMSILIVITFLPTMNFIRDVDKEADNPRALREFAMNVTNHIDDGCIVLTEVPQVLILNGQNAMNMRLVQNRDDMLKVFNKYGCVYFLEGYWCQTNPIKRVCENVLEFSRTHRIDSFTTSEGWEYNFYKLHPI